MHTPTSASYFSPCVLEADLCVVTMVLQEAIAAAKSLEEVQQLESLLKAGQLTTRLALAGGQGRAQHFRKTGQIVEEDLDDD